MNGTLLQATDFLIRIFFELYIFAVVLRFLMQMTRADFYNPVSQFLVTVTNPCLLPLRRVIPGFWGVDMAALFLAVFLSVLKNVALFFLVYQTSPNLLGLLGLSIVDLLKAVLNIYFWAIIILAVISWVNPGLHSPVTSVLYGLTEPVMRPVRRVVPVISGLDLSPLFVIIGLQLVDILFINPLGNTLKLLTANVIR